MPKMDTVKKTYRSNTGHFFFFYTLILCKCTAFLRHIQILLCCILVCAIPKICVTLQLCFIIPRKMITFILCLVALVVGFLLYGTFVERVFGIDEKAQTPALTKTDGTELLTQEQANALNGYLHMRFYRDELNAAGHYGNPQHTKENKDADGNVTSRLSYVAYGYTTAYPRDAYMGLFISDLRFYARRWTQDGDETKTPRITAMTVVLTVAKRDANNQIVPLCTQKAIVQLPGEPVILYEPGTWDGNPSSES